MAHKTGGLLDNLSKIQEKIEAGATFDRTTDSLEALSEAIAGLSLLTTKEKSFMGKWCDPLKDYFNQVASGAAPTATYWTVASATVIAETAGDLGCEVNSTASGVASGYMYTRSKYFVNPVHSLFSEIHLKCRYKINDLTGQSSMGFVAASESTITGDELATASNSAGIYCNNDVLEFVSDGSGGAEQRTAVTAYFANNTWIDIEIKLVKGVGIYCYLNGTLRASHTTSYPNETCLSIFSAAKNANSVQTKTYHEYMEVWYE